MENPFSALPHSYNDFDFSCFFSFPGVQVHGGVQDGVQNGVQDGVQFREIWWKFTSHETSQSFNSGLRWS